MRHRTSHVNVEKARRDAVNYDYVGYAPGGEVYYIERPTRRGYPWHGRLTVAASGCGLPHSIRATTLAELSAKLASLPVPLDWHVRTWQVELWRNREFPEHAAILATRGLL